MGRKPTYCQSPAEQARKVAEPLLASEGMELVAIEFRPERGGRCVLRLYVDQARGVTLDDCARISRQLGDLLDVHDVIPGPYTLEVSSPGVNRPLTCPEHFRRYVGQRVRVRTREPLQGTRRFLGTLERVEAEGVLVRNGNHGIVFIPFGAMERANYEHDFSAPVSR